MNWGIIGLGRIARLFAEDLRHIEDGTLLGVASTSLERAEVFAAEFDVPSYYGSYPELFADPDIDIVYVATYHHTHCALAIEAMNAGKHVLCEKPVGMNRNEALQMIRASEENKVFFMEAFWSRFNPSIRKAKSLIDKNEIGSLRYLNAEFTFHVLDSDPKGRMLNTALGGGSLLDMGVYPIFLSYLLFGKPQEVKAQSQFHETGAEIQTSMLFQYENAQAILYSGFASNTDMRAKIGGEKGEIFIEPIWHEAQGLTLRNNGKETYMALPTLGKGFTYEIKECHFCILNGKIKSDIWSHLNAIELISIVDQVRKKAGITFPFES
jgi:predicted dehydrogenase